MKQRNYGYMNDVDDLIQRTSLEVVLNHYGLPVGDRESNEHRMRCVFNEACTESQYGNLSVARDAFKRIYSHCCRVSGNLLTLIHGLEHGQAPAGGRLRGQEFKDAVAKLRDIASTDGSPAPATPVAATLPSRPPKPAANTPLIRHEKEGARKLANLHEELIVDPAKMSPEAGQYVRQRPWMTPELMRKWGVGWIPGSGRSLFRKHYLVYTHRNAQGEVVSYSGRDLSFEAKWEQWLRHDRPEGKKPNKHRYVKGYQRGLELYGGHNSRLRDGYVPESLSERGLVVVEGMNEVLRMETLGVCAVGLGGNTPTGTQIKAIIANARSVASSRVVLLPDCDEEGERGFKELLWTLSEVRLDVRLALSRAMFGGRFAGRQPESLSDDEWQEIDGTLRSR